MNEGNKKMTNLIKKDTIVTIKPEWQDKGDADLIWVTLDDEEKGRIVIAAFNKDMTPFLAPINPICTVTMDMITV